MKGASATNVQHQVRIIKWTAGAKLPGSTLANPAAHSDFAKSAAQSQVAHYISIAARAECPLRVLRVARRAAPVFIIDRVLVPPALLRAGPPQPKRPDHQGKRRVGNKVFRMDVGPNPGRSDGASSFSVSCSLRGARQLQVAFAGARGRLLYRLKTAAGSIRTTLMMALTAANTHMPIVNTSRPQTRVKVVRMGMKSRRK